MANDLRDWDQYLQPLGCFYSMQGHRPAETTPIDLVQTCHPPSTILPETAVRSGTPAFNEIMSFVQYEQATFYRFRSAMENAWHKQIATQKKYKENFEKRIRF